jgi:hypothetical protein
MKHAHRLDGAAAVAGPSKASARSPMAAAALLALGACTSAWAAPFDTGNPDLKLRWDNTLKYSAGFRVKGQSDALVNAQNFAGFAQDDGNRNFDKGLISNRIDLLSELDVEYKSVGLRVSGAAWYDDVYNRSNDFPLSAVSPVSPQHRSVAYNEFPEETRNVMGRKAEILDAFIHGRFTAGEVPVTVRAGQHTLVYGESLFFGNNGIAGGMAPLDIVKLVGVPSSQFKEILRPVNQVSAQAQLTGNLTLGSYYQFEWDKSRLPPSGSYLNTVDSLGPGAETFGPFTHARDIGGKDSGQGGLMLRYRPEGADIELGLYAIRYHDKTPQLYVDVGSGQFNYVYPENIQAYGASFSTNVGGFNVAGEATLRRNVPLVSVPVFTNLAATGGDADDRALYAVGKTAHLQLSAIYQFGKSALWDGGIFLGEVAWNRRLSVDKNRQMLDPNTTRDATALRFIFEPAYYQLLPAFDLSVPIGLGYGLSGKSSAVTQFNPGGEHGGDFSIGLKGVLQNRWNMGITYTHFFGKARTTLVDNVDPAASGSPVMFGFGQPLRDRNFISLYVQGTF